MRQSKTSFSDDLAAYKRVEQKISAADPHYMGSREQKAAKRDFYKYAEKRHGRPTNSEEWGERRAAQAVRTRLNREVNPGLATRASRGAVMGIGAAIAAVGVLAWRIVKAPFTGEPAFRQNNSAIQRVTEKQSPVMKAVTNRTGIAKQAVLKKLDLPTGKKQVRSKKVGRRIG